MRLYRHWARAEAAWTDALDWHHATAAYAGSDQSVADAKAQAQATLQGRVAFLSSRAPAGPDPFRDYPPPDQPIREALLWRQDDPDGQPNAALTRSNSGYLVLNTTRLMIVDVDRLPLAPAQRLGALLRRLWFRPPPEAAAAASRGSAEPLEQALRSWLRASPGWGLRVYRTRAGYRYLVTHEPQDIREPASLEALRRLHADPLYVRLCRFQVCYRARLTPKPHRIGWHRPPQTFPYRDDAEAGAQREWEGRYEALSAGFSSAELIGQYGRPEIHPELRPLIDLHDRHALHPARPLA